MAQSQPESFGISYRVLFTVRVRHRYFLNYGTTAFDATVSNELAKKLELIQNVYDVGLFWEIAPDADTQELLTNQRMLFRKRPDGFVVAVATETIVVQDGTGVVIDRYEKPFVPLSAGLKLVFALYSTDAFFMLYTNIEKAVMDELAGPNRVFRLKNKATNANLSDNRLNSSETIRSADLEDRPPETSVGGVSRVALGFIEIEHQPASRSLLGAHERVQPPLAFTLTLGNRATQWRHKTNNLGEFRLVRQGLIATPGPIKLPNPTPATTTVDVDGLFYSTIY